MNKANEAKCGSDLQLLCDHVAQWRAHRKNPKSCIPDEIWEEAVAVAHIAGPYATAKATHFNYENLKSRMALNPYSRENSDRTAFVELQMTTVASTATQVQGKMIVEMLSVRGDRMRIEADSRTLDALSLAQAFWRLES